MATRAEIQYAFVARFHFGERSDPATDEQLDAVERELNTKLPVAYRQFMKRYGVVYTPSILNETADGQLGGHDIQEFFELPKAIEYTTMYWSGGMPDDVIGIASDCMGNMIGFRRQSAPSDDAPVIFFDHDYVEVHQVSPSFDDFLHWYVEHLHGE